MAMLKRFEGLMEESGEYDLIYHSGCDLIYHSGDGEHFVEMGSVYDCHYPATVEFRERYSNYRTLEMNEEFLKRVCFLIKKFQKKNNIPNIDEKSPRYNTTKIIAEIVIPDEYEQICCIVWADYSDIWIELCELDHQTVYPEYLRKIIFPARLFLTAFKKLKELKKEFGFPKDGFMYSKEEL